MKNCTLRVTVVEVDPGTQDVTLQVALRDIKGGVLMEWPVRDVRRGEWCELQNVGLRVTGEEDEGGFTLEARLMIHLSAEHVKEILERDD